MSWREVKRRFERTALGPIWVSLNLAIFTIVLGIVWSKLFSIDVATYLPFLIAGLIPWTFFTTSLTEAGSALINAQGEMMARRIPATFFLNVCLMKNFFVFLISLPIVFIYLIIFDIQLTWYIFSAIAGILVLTLNLWWIGLAISIFCLRYRDGLQMVNTLLQIALFVTPVLWPVEALGERARYLADWNVLFHFVAIVRDPLLGIEVNPLSWQVSIGAVFFGIAFSYFLLRATREKLIHWY
ncbi:ABC transporter permease [Litorivicinus sp.]|nr:ABC transporter permease [Litorivicinus sp.]